VSATAADSDGTIARVEFFDNGSPIGQPDTTSPYSVTWSASGNGSHSLTAKATDNSGNSTTSAARSVNVSGCSTGGGGLGRHVITGYWHNFNNGSTVLKLRNVPATYNLIAVAFADATGTPGAVTFNLDPVIGYSGTAEFVSDVDAINAQNGRKVIISVGGQNGFVSVNSSTSATNFANSVIGLMNTFHFAGVDIDLENGINSTFMAQALRAVKAAKPNAIITMAPQTIDMQSTGMEYFKLALDIRDILTIVNMQYYNSGSMLGCDGQVYSQGGVNFLTALACIQLQSALRPDQVGLGLPASLSGAGSGFVSPSVVNNALDCLAAGTNCGSFRPPRTWPGIRGAMTWSINWDAVQGFSWVNTINGHIGSVP
jgi:chitinase